MKLHLPSFLRPVAPNSSFGYDVAPPAEPRCAQSPTTRPRLQALPSPLGAARPGLLPGPGAPCLRRQRSPALTSSLCVDGHFFRRRPQFSRFPVCRCRVRARARSAPAARLSVFMAAADGGGQAAMGPQAGKEAAPQTRSRGWKAEREAARPAWRDLGLRWGPREAGRRRSGGPEKTR